jgi:phosphatidylglycerophosphate synthase
MRASDIFRRVVDSYYGKTKAALERDYLLYRFLYRPLSFPLTVLAILARLSANQVSALNVLVLLGALTLLVWGTGTAAVAGAVAFFLFYVLDFVDGNVARYHQASSYFGKLIDGFIDTLAYLVFLAAPVAAINAGTTLLHSDVLLGMGIATTISALICQNYRFRLAYLKAEIGAGRRGQGASGGGDAGGATGNSVLSAANRLHENVAVSTPLLLLLLAVVDMLGVFVAVFFLVHCVSGPAGVAVSLARNRKALTVDRDH